MGITIDWWSWVRDVVAAIGVCFVALAPTVLPYLSKKKRAREAYQRQLVLELMSDIEILYYAEARYLEMIKDLTGSNLKHRIRQEVEIDTGLEWTGRFTPGRNKDRLRRLHQKT